MSLSKNTIVVDISDLIYPKENVRMHTQRQINEIVRSLEMFGQIRPAVIDENNVILAGCGLVEALKAKGETNVEVFPITGLSEKQKKKLMIADNKVYSLGVDNLEVMEKFIHDLSDDLDIPGFDENILRAMVAEAEQVTKQISNYGKIDNDKQNSLRAAAERKENLIEHRTEVNKDTPDNTQHTHESNSASGSDEETNHHSRKSNSAYGQ